MAGGDTAAITGRLSRRSFGLVVRPLEGHRMWPEEVPRLGYPLQAQMVGSATEWDPDRAFVSRALMAPTPWELRRIG
jgi:hypothetical protein